MLNILYSTVESYRCFLRSVTMSLAIDTDLWYNANIPCFHKDKDMEDDL